MNKNATQTDYRKCSTCKSNSIGWAPKEGRDSKLEASLQNAVIFMSKILFYSSKLCWKSFVCFKLMNSKVQTLKNDSSKNSINVDMNKIHISLRGLIISTYQCSFKNMQQSLHYLLLKHKYLHTKRDWYDTKLWKIRCNSESWVRNNVNLQLWMQDNLMILVEVMRNPQPISVVSDL